MEDAQVPSPKETAEEPKDPSQLNAPDLPGEKSKSLLSNIKGMFKHKQPKVRLPDAKSPGAAPKPQIPTNQVNPSATSAEPVAQTVNPVQAEAPVESAPVQQPVSTETKAEDLPSPKKVEDAAPDVQESAPEQSPAEVSQEDSVKSEPVVQDVETPAEGTEAQVGDQAEAIEPTDTIQDQIDKLTMNEDIINQGREELNKQISEVDDKIKKIDQELEELMKL